MHVRNPAPALAFEPDLAQRTDRCRFAAEPLRGDAQRKRLHARSIAKRQRQTQVLARARQAFDVTQLHATGAIGGNREDAQLEVIARGLLQQRRVHLPAFDGFEYLPALGFLHGHRRTQLAVEIQRETGNVLPVAQWEIQVAFQRPCVRIEEHHLDRGLGQATHHDRVDIHRTQRDRHLGATHLQ